MARGSILDEVVSGLHDLCTASAVAGGGTWDRILRAVQANADFAGGIDWNMISVDSTSCRAHQHAAGAPKQKQIIAPSLPEVGGLTQGGLWAEDGCVFPPGFGITVERMRSVDLLSVHEAAEALNVDDSRIRQLLRGGRLQGQRVGGRWLVDGAAVRERRDRDFRPGRPLSPRNAWGLLAVLAGDSSTGLSDAEKSRVVARLRNIAAHEHLPAARLRHLLAARAERRRYRVHSGLLEAVLTHPDVVRTGVSATGEVHADYVAPGRAEVYVRSDKVGELTTEFGMIPDLQRGNLTVRIPPAGQWPFLSSFLREGVAPPAVVAADLLDIREDRADAAAAGLLRPLLARYSPSGGK